MAESFISLQGQLREGLYSHRTPEFKYQLYVMYGLFGLSFLFVVGALGLRIKQGGFWVVRRQITSRGTWITPNSITSFLLLCGIYLPCMMILAWYNDIAGTVGSNTRNSMLWRCLSWLPFWISGWILAWTTALSPLLARPDSALARYPMTFSISCLAVIFIGIATSVPLSVAANNSFNKLFDMFIPLDAGLTMAIAALKNGGLSLEQTQALMLRIESGAIPFEAEVERLAAAWRRVWITWCALDGFLLLFFSIAAGFHFNWLGDSIKRLKRKRQSESRSKPATCKSSDRDEDAKQMRSLVWAFRSLVFTSTMTLICSFLYLTLSLVLAFKVNEVIRGSQLEEIISLAALYIYAIFGTLINLILFVRSFAVATPAPTFDLVDTAFPLKSTDASRRRPLTSTFQARGAEFTFQLGHDDDDYNDFDVRHDGSETNSTFTPYTQRPLSSQQRYQNEDKKSHFSPAFGGEHEELPAWDYREAMYRPGVSQTVTVDLGRDGVEEWRAGGWTEAGLGTSAGRLPRKMEKARA